MSRAFGCGGARAAELSEIKPPFYGWTLLAALWGVMFLNLGFPSYGPAVINAAMAHTLGLRREQLGNLFLVYMIMSGLPGPLVALGINRFGVRRTLLAGSALLILGALLMGTVVDGPLGALLCYGGLIGAGVATGSALTSQTGLARWFVRRRSFALSILYSANAIGGFVAAPLLERLIEASGTWRAGWWLIAALAAVAGVIVVMWVRERPEDVGQLADGAVGEPAGAATSVAAATAGGERSGGERARDDRPVRAPPPFVTRRAWSFGEACRRPIYWMLLIALIGCTGGYALILAHGVVHLQDLGHSARTASWAVALMSASGLIGKLILAAFGDRIDPRYILALFIGVFGVGLLVIVDARAPWEAFAATTCLGIGFGGGFVCMMAVLSNYFGTSAFASLAGLAVAINTTVAAFAPKVAGHLFDQGYGYGAAFHFLAAWCCLGAAALCFARREKIQ